MNDIIQIFENNFKISNKVFLRESYGVSDEITAISNDMFGVLKNDMENKNWTTEWINLKEYKIKQGSVIFKEKHGLPINYAKYIIFDIEKEDIDKIGINLEYNADLKYMNIVWYSINGEIDYNRLHEYFTHEIMHGYQWSKGLNLTSKLYQTARNILNGSDENKTIYMLAQLIYWLYKPETSAHCQQLYVQMANNKVCTYEDLTKCETYRELEYMKKLVSHLNANDGVFNYQYFPEYFNGIDYITLRRKINGSYNYAVHKLSRTIMKYLNKDKITENKKIKYYGM